MILDLPPEIAAKISPEPNTGCWLWNGSVNSTGYGLLKSLAAHRIIYQMLVGRVPEGLDLDHLCRVRCCVNPAHLEPVTRAENCNRGLTGHHMKALKAMVTHCPQGHLYDADNVIMRAGGGRGPYRVCGTCKRERDNAAYHRHSETILAALRAKYVKKADRT